VPVTSATLYLSLKSAGATTSRPISVYRVSKSFLEKSANWYDYRDSSRWGSAGGDFAEKWATVNVGRTVGSRISVDVTDLVQRTVSGSFGSRYTRIALVDTGAADNESLRAFFSSRAADATVRPKLVVTYGTSTSTSTATGGTSVSSTTLKVMTYNTHHGVGTDGVYNLDRVATAIANQRPDVVSLNEVMYNSGYGNGENQPETYKRLLQQKTGQTWYYVYARMDGNWTSTSWAVGNQLLSRFPLSTTTKHYLTYDRAVAHGTIIVNGRTVNLFSTHLDAGSTSCRLTQEGQLLNIASAWAESRIIMGDFNARPGSSEIAKMTSTYYDTWAQGLSSGIASAPTGSLGYTMGLSRLDFIFRSRNASSLALTSVKVVNTAGSYGVKPSDHDPLMATFSIR
jgi:endonuclease/exonuclease/phosphatase family metal-dependent hydrolase